MSYATLDHQAALADLIAFEGKMIEIDGVKMRAIIEQGDTSFEASEFGIDNRESTLTATILNRGTTPRKQAPVFYQGQKYRITAIKPDGERILSIDLTND
jgi:hypothetical protein